ncbi:Asah1 protein [Salpingoeca rosetta]|uniref:Acid ceramidase n=1 Tax=Salpingoeca rosetta (strain ATCC 50818 / BSB-021) TaxID=946362 RepID=F2TVK5_SALR5|nr:Asah1 protein [Salpingoeca rosetta]EGD72101.1 Asah1 protein [Salpingoeca rosetta]|eukprot:XP_004998673.1 Asah1 protein [Salpingoeca rosetta]
MNVRAVLFVTACVAVAVAAPAPAAAAAKCNMKSLYPPTNTELPWHTIDLDLPPQERWAHVVRPKAKQIHDMIYQVIDLIPAQLRKTLMEHIDAKADEILDAFPAPYGDEIRGIANATGVDVGALILYNMGYEIEGGCTSIVAQNSEGNVFHARNLDFGLGFGWDKANETWALTEKLRPLLFNARVVRNGNTLFNATYYAGFVGLLTGMKTGGFSISVDTRFDNSFWKGLIDFFKGDHSGHFVAFTTRSVMENNATYADALKALTSAKMVGPSYMILGGAEAKQGAIITRSSNESLHLWTLENDLHNKHFYVLETNYDNWVEPPFFDDRRHPAEACLDQLGASGMGFAGLYNTLSAQPNLNLLTTYTTLMHVATGRFEAYVQKCDTHPCTPW